MATNEFNAIVDAFIERESQDCGELPAAVFYDALENIFRKPADAVTVELQAQVVGSELQFALPDVAVPGVVVQGNQIMMNNRLYTDLFNTQYRIGGIGYWVLRSNR